jgi:hypothetical protein
MLKEQCEVSVGWGLKYPAALLMILPLTALHTSS